MMQRGETGEGYVYLRDRARGTDTTIYLHQLAALQAGFSVSEVFDDATEVHHTWPVKLWNTPTNIEVVDVDEHNDLHDRPYRPGLTVATDGGRE